MLFRKISKKPCKGKLFLSDSQRDWHRKSSPPTLKPINIPRSDPTYFGTGKQGKSLQDESTPGLYLWVDSLRAV